MIIAVVGVVILALDDRGRRRDRQGPRPGARRGRGRVRAGVGSPRLRVALHALRARSCATASTVAGSSPPSASAYEQQHELGGLVEHVGIDQVANRRDAAVAITEVELHDRAVVHNRVELARRNGRWQVVAYRLEPSAEDAPRTDG